MRPNSQLCKTENKIHFIYHMGVNHMPLKGPSYGNSLVHTTHINSTKSCRGCLWFGHHPSIFHLAISQVHELLNYHQKMFKWSPSSEHSGQDKFLYCLGTFREPMVHGSLMRTWMKVAVVVIAVNPKNHYVGSLHCDS